MGAHLQHEGLEYRVFGRTMGAWRFNMPAGMLLKSEPYASDLSAPGPGFLARDYCAEAEEVYHERVIPLSREQFIDYGSWFAHQLVPGVEETEVVSLTRVQTGGFMLRTATGERIRAARVVVATGIMPFAFVPPELSELPSELVSHTSEHSSLEGFRGKDVLVVGGGSSALETAALLHEQGAAVKLVIRGEGVSWPSRQPRKSKPTATAPQTGRSTVRGVALLGLRPIARRLQAPPRGESDRTRLGLPGSSRVPGGYAGGSKGQCRCSSGTNSLAPKRWASAFDSTCATPRATSAESADHVIAGTGFHLDVTRLDYITPSLRADLKILAGAPVLNRNLESNVPGLFFTGALAAPSLGPLMRFVAGTHFTGPRLVHRLRVNRA